MLDPSFKLQMKGKDVCGSIGHSYAISFHLFPSVKSIPVLFFSDGDEKHLKSFQQSTGWERLRLENEYLTTRQKVKLAENQALTSPLTAASEMCHSQDPGTVPQKNSSLNQVFH